MAYLKPVYIVFDGKNDLQYYQEMQGWVQSDGLKFNFIDGLEFASKIDKLPDEEVKALIKEKINLTEVFVLLVTKNTKRYRKFIRWQVEAALELQKPIIIVNVNKIRSVDYDRIPIVFRRKNLSLHITFQAPIFEFALERWPESHYQHLEKKEINTYRYSQQVYEKLNLSPNE